ncbi:hypothetical protein [Acinetobacter sp. ANC 4177]|uniref:hypothetical protein n=1 Tax=Acinetobacter sp. ANC 4177 TaxID=2529838 RepID=UPI00103FD42F|nr:hypothetical protein [Acinetobacter sp. ANC 4177]TCB74270.1 hypothetical protein E0H91_10175 [Acinetobacter sp. ANC 4177]
MKTLESMELFAPNSNQLTDPCEGVFIDEIVSDKGNSLHPYLREQFKRFYEERALLHKPIVKGLFHNIIFK